MLVLSRKKAESVVINKDIVVTMVEVQEDKVHLGIVAPKDVPVHRQEVYEAILAAAASKMEITDDQPAKEVKDKSTTPPKDDTTGRRTTKRKSRKPQ